MKLTLARVSLAALLVGIGGFASAQAPEAISVVEGSSASSPDMINLLHQREWVRLDDGGNITGKVSVLDARGTVEGRVGAKIIVSRDGNVALETISDVDGSFVLEGLKPGSYAIQSRGEYTFAAYALHVLPAESKHLSSDLDIYASVIPSQRAAELLNSSMVPADLAPGQDVYYREFSQDPLAEKREFNKSHKVALRDGALVGRVSRPGWTFGEQDLTGTVAQIVREGEIVAKAPVGKDGYYRVEKLEPGVYDLFVTGDDGYAVLAFEAVEPSEPVASSRASGAHLVSTQVGMASDCLCCEMICQPEVNACNSCEVAQSPILSECDTCVDGIVGASPVMGGGFAGPGGFGGGGAGGGGFGGAGGGIGGLLGIAGLAVGITALSNNDSFNATQASLIAP